MLRLVTFACPGQVRLGALARDFVVDLGRVDPSLPNSMYDLIVAGDTTLEIARAAVDRIVADYQAQAEQLVRDRKVYPTSAVQLLAPIPRPHRNVLCVGRNYEKHVMEGARSRGEVYKPLEYPEFFSKPPAAVVGTDAPFPHDEAVTQRLDYEAELAIVIGRGGRNISRERAYEHVFGYTVGNDVSAREIQRRHGQWFKGKGLDSSCPLGPAIVPHKDIGDPQQLGIKLRVNGETRQNASTSEMTFKVRDIIYWLSLGTTLEPGDVILTGTPDGVGNAMTPPSYLWPGDVVEAEIENIGVLRTHIVRA